MAHSRLVECSEPNCGVLFHNGAGHEIYPQAQSKLEAPVRCPMENYKWVGEANLYEDHRLKEHPSYIVEPVEYNDATHMVVPKKDHEKCRLLQDKLGKLALEVTQKKKLELEKEKKWKEAKEERERREDDWINCYEKLQRMTSHSSKNVDPVIQRSVVSNQQGGASSTASLGRAEQLPQQELERSRTLDAEGSDFQQFRDVFEQEDNDHEEEYQQPQPQIEQQSKEVNVLVGSPTGNEPPPPLPPKPKQNKKKDSPSANVVPPILPPKPNSNPPPLQPRNQGISTRVQPNDTIPPPRPPKPSQAKAAIPQPQRSRLRKSPPPSSQKHESGEQRREMNPSNVTYENSMYTVSHGTTPGDCPNCVHLKENNDRLKEMNYSLKESNDRLKCLFRDCLLNGNTHCRARRSRLPTE